MGDLGRTLRLRARPADLLVDAPYHLLMFVILGGLRDVQTPVLRALPYAAVALAVAVRCLAGLTRVTADGVEDRRYVPARRASWDDVVRAPQVVSRLGVTRVELPTTGGRRRLSTPAAVGPFGAPRVEAVRAQLAQRWQESRARA
jgi:hypothetical protein